MSLSITRILIFDIWGDYAHFRKIETTTSPLTYSIPTGTALAGLTSAIIGRTRDSYYSFFGPDKIKFAIEILNPIKKIRININLLGTEKDKGNLGRKNGIVKGCSPTSFEFVKNPKYRTYAGVVVNNSGVYDFFETLKKFLVAHKTIYTPYLGISELIANFCFIADISGKDITNLETSGNLKINSAIRIGASNVIIENDKFYTREVLPWYMDENRIVKDYAQIMFESNALPFTIGNFSTQKIYKIKDSNIIFL
jgi:CRISPR-associated protein Cas5h